MNEQHNITLIVQTVLKDEGVLRRLNGDLQRLDAAGNKSSMTWRKAIGTFAAVTAALGAMAVAGKKAYEFTREGADLLFTQSKFDRWAQQIGSTADALMSDLIPAARGTASNMGMMKMALDLMSLGLADSHEEVVRLSNVAVKLGMNMDQLVLTLTNKTIRRFDSLGVSVDGFKERFTELKETMSEDDAFTLAFLEQAEKQLAITGEAADTIAGTYMGLEAAWANYADSVKMDLAIFFESTAEWLTTLLNAHNEIRRNASDFRSLMEATGGEVGASGFMSGAAFMDPSMQYAGYDNVLQGYLTFQTAFGQQLMSHQDAARFIDNLNLALDELGWTFDDLAFKSVEEMQAFNALIDAYVMGEEDAKVFAETQAEVAEETQTAADAAKEAEKNYEHYLDSLDPGKLDLFQEALEKIAFSEAGGEGVQNFAQMFLDADGNLKDLNISMENFNELMLVGQAASLATEVSMGNMTLWEARRDLRGFTDDWAEVDRLLPDVETAMGNMELQSTVLEVAEALGSSYEYAYRMVTGLIEANEALDGSEAEVFINYIVNGVQVEAMPDGWMPPTGSTGKYWKAGGGSITDMGADDITMVGEKGYEMIMNGMVIPHEVSKWLLAAGVRPGQQRALGGPLSGGPLIDGLWTPQQMYDMYFSSSSSASSSSSGGGDSTIATAEAKAEVAETASRQAAKAVGEKMAEQAAVSADEQTGTLKDIYKVLRGQPSKDDLAGAMKSAVQEALAS